MPADKVMISDARRMLFGGGSIASRLIKNSGDFGVLRPFIGEDGRDYITVPNGKFDKEGRMLRHSVMVQNYVAGLDGTLRVREWIELDRAVVKASRPPMRAFGDLRAQGLTYTIPEGMAKTVLQYETQSNITPATISMDGLQRGDGDRPVYDLQSMPLPIVHKDFTFSGREVMTSRGGLSPLDLTTADLAARRVAETVEKLTLGTIGYAYGGGNIYGYTNFPNRMTYSMATPVQGNNYGPQLADVLQMKQKSLNAFHTGPWMVYVSPDWDVYLDDDYAYQKVSGTLRERIKAVAGIVDVVTLYFLPQNTMLFVQLTQDVARAVIGMDVMTLQWPTQGGLELNFKVMCILLPQVRCDQYGNTGIVHGTYTPTTTTTTSTTSTTSTTTTSTTTIP